VSSWEKLLKLKSDFTNESDCAVVLLLLLLLLLLGHTTRGALNLWNKA
jgi:hypothetical protein